MVLENQIKELEHTASKEIRENIDTAMEALSNIKKNFFEAKNKMEELSSKIFISKSDINKLNKEIEELRHKFTELYSHEFDKKSKICPTCNQSLPVEDIDAHRTEFEDYKQATLLEINDTGKSKKTKLGEVTASLEEYKGEYLESKEKVSMLAEMLENKESEVKEFERQLKTISIQDTKEYKELQSRINHLELQKEEMKKLSQEQDNTAEIKKLESQISFIDKELAKVDLVKDNEKRIDSLKSRERELAQMVADTEKTEFLCDQFVISRSNLLEDKLNSKFNLVKFKLFDIQVNGGINETFVTTVDGVPFEDLNNAMKINAGLDIINTLTDYYNFKAPIFIDNREGVNEIIDVTSQVINLRVSKHKSLRVEVEQ